MKSNQIKKMGIELILITIGIIILWAGCGQKRQVALVAERGTQQWDYPGKFAKTLDKDMLTHQDSVNIIGYLYQAAAMDSRLYELQSKLTSTYFWDCHERCAKRSCTSGNIAAAMADYLLKGQIDSAKFVNNWIDRDVVGKAPEIREVNNITGFIADRKFENDWQRPYQDGLIKTPTGTALWVVTSIDAGADPKPWIALLTSALKTSDAPSLKYAIAYALMKSGSPLVAWQTMPVYIPGANQFAPPDFTQEIAGIDTSNLTRIYLTLNQYIIGKVEQTCLQSLIADYSSLSAESMEKVTILGNIKGMNLQIDLDKPMTTNDSGAEINKAISLAKHPETSPEVDLSKLSNPLARAIFLQAESSNQNTNKAIIKDLIFSELENPGPKDDWETEIILTLALGNVLTSPEALTRISNLLPQDSILTDYSPEWLALYASYCVGDNTKSEKLTKIGGALRQAYPYAPGIKELADKINLICR